MNSIIYTDKCEGYVQLVHSSSAPVNEEDDSLLTTGERTIVAAARMSTNRGLKGDVNDLKLLQYLYKHNHTSPFEMANVTVDIHAPLFVLIHFLRHRTGKFNQFSGRYSEYKEDSYYSPLQNPDREFTPEQVEEIKKSEELVRQLFFNYKNMINLGIQKEIARFAIPQSVYSTLRMQMDVNNLLKLLTLRCEENAQLETRQYADAIATLVKPHFPNVFALWEERQQTITFSPREMKALQTGVEEFNSVSEEEAWKRKKEILKAYA